MGAIESGDTVLDRVRTHSATHSKWKLLCEQPSSVTECSAAMGVEQMRQSTRSSIRSLRSSHPYFLQKQTAAIDTILTN